MPPGWPARAAGTTGGCEYTARGLGGFLRAAHNLAHLDLCFGNAPRQQLIAWLNERAHRAPVLSLTLIDSKGGQSVAREMAEVHFKRGTPPSDQLPVIITQGERQKLTDALSAEEGLLAHLDWPRVHR